MKFLLVNRFYGDDQTPTSRMLGDVTHALLERGHEVHILSSDAQYYEQAKTGTALANPPGLQVHLVHVPTWAPRALQWAMFHAVSFLRSLQLDWDRVVYLTDPPFLTSQYPLQKWLKPQSKAFLWSMDLYPEALASAQMLQESHPLYRLLRGLNGWSFEHLTGAIVLGECQRQRLAQYPSFEKLTLQPLLLPPWDSRDIQPVSKAENLFLRSRPDLADKKILLYAGNLGAGHSYEAVVALAQFLQAQDRHDWVFLFAVRGQRVAALQQACQNLPQIQVIDYVSAELTDHLLSAADVHLITMTHQWEGVIVPSKLYGCLKTGRPVLFIGPETSGTAHEIQKLEVGLTLALKVAPEQMLFHLEELRNRASTAPVLPTKSLRTFCDYVTS